MDEEVLKESVGIRPVSVDEAVKIIFSRLQGDTKEFSYASFVRSKKNLYDELFLKSQNPMIVSRWKQAMEQACLL